MLDLVRPLPALLLLFAFTACTPPSRSFVVVQNGLEVTATLHRDMQHQNLRIVTVGLRDARSHKPIPAAEVAVQSSGKKAVAAVRKVDGSFEAALDEPPGSSADIGIVVFANGKDVVFRLQRP
jgi:hypothetical protein